MPSLRNLRTRTGLWASAGLMTDKLHAGSEALDRPSGPPPGQPGAGNWSSSA